MFGIQVVHLRIKIDDDRARRRQRWGDNALREL